MKYIDPPCFLRQLPSLGLDAEIPAVGPPISVPQVSAKRLPLNRPVRALHSADWNTVSAPIRQARWAYCGLLIFEGRPLLLGGISQRAVLRRDPVPRNRRGAAGGVAEIISYECDHPSFPSSPRRGPKETTPHS